MKHVNSFRDLEVYRLARQEAKRIFHVSRTFPKEEMYSLVDQVRRSSRSVGAQIAEAWANRKYEKHFISKLTIADGEQMETQHWIETSKDSSYISDELASEMLQQYSLIGKMLNSMINKARYFCGNDGAMKRTPPITDH